jgi:leucyl-tRNA synthetase
MVDFKEIELKWQKRWREAKAFDADPDPKRQKYYLTVPYPYANAPMHVGHGRTYTIGDVVARYKRMRGFNVLWPMAAHVTGTPVFGVARRIEKKDPALLKEYGEHIELYRPKKDVPGILATFSDPMAIARFFAEVFEADFRKLGYSIDWRRKFTTNDPEYQAFVTWQFQQLYQLGYITKGAYPVLYCTACNNAVGEDDLLAGEDAKVAEFIAIKFPYEDGYLVAATLRPETVYGVTNLWVNPHSSYVKLKVGEEHWYVAEPAVHKLELQGHKATRVADVPGRTLVGKTCKSPVEDRDLLILPADFVDPNNATGVVYSVPSHAPFDWIALRDLQQDLASLREHGLKPATVKAIQPISIISVEGYGAHPAIELVDKMKIKNQKETEKLEEATETLYRAEFYGGVMKDNCGAFARQRISQVKDNVVTFLAEHNRAFRFYQPDRRPVICRCNNPVEVAVLPDQWFINYGDPKWKAQATQALQGMVIFPEMYRRLFESTFEWLKERPCARRRGLGTPLPFGKGWIIESLSDSTIYMAFYLLIHYIHANQIKPTQLSGAFFDYVLLGKGDAADVATKTRIPRSLVEKMRAEFEYWYPNDQRHTAISHISNHLSFFIFHHAAIFPENLWPRAITLNEHVIREGVKMSKSKGNALPLADVPRRYGADLYRLYITQIGDLQTLVDWREKDVVTVRRRFNRFISILQEATSAKTDQQPEGSLGMTDRWILSKVNSTIQTATDALDHFRFRSYVLESFFGLLGHVEFFLRRVKKTPEREALLHYVAERWVKLLAPLMPHLCEEFWEQLGHLSFVSLEAWPVVDERFLEKNVENAMDVVSQTIADIKELNGLLRRKKASKASIYVSPEWKYEALAALKASKAALTVKDLMPVLMANPKLRSQGKAASELAQAIAKVGGYWTFVDKTTELQALKECADFIQAETGLVPDIQDGDAPVDDPEHRVTKALPGRPALYLS